MVRLRCGCGWAKLEILAVLAKVIDLIYFRGGGRDYMLL